MILRLAPFAPSLAATAIRAIGTARTDGAGDTSAASERDHVEQRMLLTQPTQP